MTRRIVPLALLAVLGLLALGFAVLALTMAPNSADLAVHNGTDETFSARSILHPADRYAVERAGRDAFQRCESSTSPLRIAWWSTGRHRNCTSSVRFTTAPS